MEPGLKEHHLLVGDTVDQPMLFRAPPGPAATQVAPQRFGLSGPFERGLERFAYQPQDLLGDRTVGVNPVAQVLEDLRGECGASSRGRRENLT